MTLRRAVRWQNLIYLLVACLGVSLYVAQAIAWSEPGFPLDDAWIHHVYGRNLATTGLWAFMPGIPSAGSTAPLYTVLLSFVHRLRLEPLLWSYVLGVLALVLAGNLAAHLGRRLALWLDLEEQAKRIGFYCGLAVVLSWHLTWAAAAGMETALFCALGLLVILLAWRDAGPFGTARGALSHGLLFGIASALLTLTRPEGIGLAGLAGMLLLAVKALQLRNTAGRGRQLWLVALWLIGAGAAFALCMAPYLSLNLQLNGTLLPDTSAAKQAENAPLLALPLWQRIANMAYPLIAGAQFALIPGALAALFWLLRRLRRERGAALALLLIAWPLALIVLYAARLPAPYQHGRYVIPALPPFLVLGTAGTIGLLARTRRRMLPRVLIRVVAVSACLMAAGFWYGGAGIYGRDVQLINQGIVQAARWIAANVPADQTLAVHDIGAVGYFAPRRLFDLAGLVSPEVVPVITNPAALMSLMEARQIPYLMASPPQLPVAPGDARLCPLYTAPGPTSAVQMTVYQFAWSGPCPKR